MYLDKMPAAVLNKQISPDKVFYDELIPIGYKASDGLYLYNHIDFTVTLYNSITDEGEEIYQVVGFQTEPRSFHFDQEMQKILDPEKAADWENPVVSDLNEINHENIEWLESKDKEWLMPQKIDETLESDYFWFSYSVKYVVQNEITWENRFKNYFSTQAFEHLGISWT